MSISCLSPVVSSCLLFWDATTTPHKAEITCLSLVDSQPGWMMKISIFVRYHAFFVLFQLINILVMSI